MKISFYKTRDTGITTSFTPICERSILLVLFFAIEAFFLWKYGIRSSWDTGEYNLNAQRILQGKSLEDFYIPYATYIFYLALHIALGGNEISMVIGQIFLAGVSVWAFYGICQRVLFPVYSFWASFLYVIWPSLRYWDGYLYTESVFVSLLVLCAYGTLLIREEKLPIVLLLLVLFALTFTRPPAWLFNVCLVAVIWVKSVKAKGVLAMKRLIWGGSALAMVTGLLILFFHQYAGTLWPSYAKGEVIYPNVCITPAIPISLVSGSGSSKILHLISNHPFWFLKMTFLKMWYFLSGTKPFYSSLHNGFALISNGFLFFFSAIASFNRKVKMEYKSFFSLFIGLNTLMVAITAENWDGRFLLPLLPFSIIFCFLGIQHVFSFKEKMN